jgi:hypothetical protein
LDGFSCSIRRKTKKRSAVKRLIERALWEQGIRRPLAKGLENKHPTEGIFHAAALDDSDNNIRVADVWESEGDLNKFVNEGLTPAMQQPPPQMEIFQIHKVNAFPSIEKYRIK